jgi:TPR repeat protein
MPEILICCASLPPATVLSVPIKDFSEANVELAKMYTEVFYPCCGKTMCQGCNYSLYESGNDDKCPFCNTDRSNKTDEEKVGELMRRVEANDAASIWQLAAYYSQGREGFDQDQTRAVELYIRAADLGYKKAHSLLADKYHEGGNLKKAKFHYEAAAMAGHEVARFNLGAMEYNAGNMERAIKHWTIGASAGCFRAMQYLKIGFGNGHASKESIDTALAAYNNSCAEMRSEARDAYIRFNLETM